MHYLLACESNHSLDCVGRQNGGGNTPVRSAKAMCGKHGNVGCETEFLQRSQNAIVCQDIAVFGEPDRSELPNPDTLFQAKTGDPTVDGAMYEERQFDGATSVNVHQKSQHYWTASVRVNGMAIGRSIRFLKSEISRRAGVWVAGLADRGQGCFRADSESMNVRIEQLKFRVERVKFRIERMNFRMARVKFRPSRTTARSRS